MMNQRDVWIADHASLPCKPQRQIKIFKVQKVALVKTTHSTQRIGATQHERTGHENDIAHVIVR